MENINTAADNVSSEKCCTVTEIKKLDAKKRLSKTKRSMTNMRVGCNSHRDIRGENIIAS